VENTFKPPLTRSQRAPRAPGAAQNKPFSLEGFALTTTIRVIRRRYTLGLGLIALLTIIAGGCLQLIIAAQDRNTNVVNVSGRQRMLSQRVALYALQLTTGTSQSRNDARTQLSNAAALMQRSHRGLIAGDAELGLPGGLSSRLRALYFAPPKGIDRQVNAFLGHIADVLRVSDGQLRADDPALAAILTAAAGPLLEAQDTATRQFSQEIAQEVNQLRILQGLVVALTLTTLVLEAVWIFRPLETEVRERTQALIGAHDATIEGWSRALDLRDKETEGHSLRVTEMTLRLGAHRRAG
jgi:hypothetical protein